VWAIFVTAILLLLSLPVLAGVSKFLIAPALNLAICWNHFLNISMAIAQALAPQPAPHYFTLIE
jgi:heme/copper-type cytochrome/quinol oxidase subunit 1